MNDATVNRVLVVADATGRKDHREIAELYVRHYVRTLLARLRQLDHAKPRGRRLTSIKPSRCRACEAPIAIGDPIFWIKPRFALCASCAPEATE